ncbi:hypothetical protein C8R45DRAFT_930280 [Mycena sanguinolenta]|nr:hypothetical protein C8R45DRAFT_930280 [Mycena sanguinolenta]
MFDESFLNCQGRVHIIPKGLWGFGNFFQLVNGKLQEDLQFGGHQNRSSRKPETAAAVVKKTLSYRREVVVAFSFRSVISAVLAVRQTPCLAKPVEHSRRHTRFGEARRNGSPASREHRQDTGTWKHEPCSLPVSVARFRVLNTKVTASGSGPKEQNTTNLLSTPGVAPTEANRCAQTTAAHAELVAQLAVLDVEEKAAVAAYESAEVECTVYEYDSDDNYWQD